MNCSCAIQILPLDAHSDEEVCAVVDEVIAYLKTCDLNLHVGPFESTIEGEYDACMQALYNCQIIAAQAGCKDVMSYVKIAYKPDGDVMSTEYKIGKYHNIDDAALGL